MFVRIIWTQYVLAFLNPLLGGHRESRARLVLGRRLIERRRQNGWSTFTSAESTWRPGAIVSVDTAR
jgi:hypothetical protein